MITDANSLQLLRIIQKMSAHSNANTSENDADTLEIFKQLLTEVTSAGSLTLDENTITQTTNFQTDVTFNVKQGVITTLAPGINAGTTRGFELINSEIKAGSIVLAQIHHTGFFAVGDRRTSLDLYQYEGGCSIMVTNVHPSVALNDPIKVHFIVF